MRNSTVLILAAALIFPAVQAGQASGENIGNDFSGAGSASSEFIFKSPYDGIDWVAVNQYKFDGHIHARRGTAVKALVIEFERLGYDIIAFGDGLLRYPPEDFDVYPDDHDITIIPGQGNLHTRRDDTGPLVHHTKVWFSEVNYDIGELGFEEAMIRVGEDGGLIVFAHPGSHMPLYRMYSFNVGADWYISYFDQHSHILGIEVTNHGRERALMLFDELLKHYGSERQVIGFGSSDTQGLDPEGNIISAGGDYGLSVIISQSREQGDIRDAIENGRLFWVYTAEPDRETNRLLFPEVESMDVDAGGISVVIRGKYDSIHWIYDNEVIKKGETFTSADIQDPGQNYVRFEIHSGKDTIVGSQAIYISRNRQAGHR